jgi:hypothetical protein
VSLTIHIVKEMMVDVVVRKGHFLVVIWVLTRRFGQWAELLEPTVLASTSK